jgi:uncharacterized membrane protein (UPF0127 family)
LFLIGPSYNLQSGRGEPMRALVIQAFIAVLGCTLHAVDQAPTTAPAQTQPATEEITIAGETFKLELAADAPSRARGLMGRKSIDDHGGMLFIYPASGILSFWMANCVIDIDLIFLDSHGRIVSMEKMKAEPPRQSGETQAAYESRLKRYVSRRPAHLAIELKAGSIEQLKLKTGQVIEADWKRLRALAR